MASSGGSGDNYGNQNIQFRFYDELTSSHFDKRSRDIVPVGIYKGGLLEKVDDSRVKVQQMVVEISDGTYQARIITQSDQVISIDSGHPYVRLSWNWQGVRNWFMKMEASDLSSIKEDDLVVGKAVYPMGSMSDVFDYSLRSTPKTLSMLLKCVALANPDYKVFVNGGWASYGSSRVDVPAAIVDMLTQPAPGMKRIDLLYVGSDGAFHLTPGGEVAGTPEPPDQSGVIPVAEIGTPANPLLSTTTEITDDMIVDCRPFVNLSGGGLTQGLLSSLLLMGA